MNVIKNVNKLLGFLVIDGKGGGFNFLLNFFAVVRNSMNVIANVKKLFEFFVIDGKGKVGIRAIL
jgi:hypothetical protein